MKSLKDRQESDMKAFLQQQKNDYRSTKLLFKKVCCDMHDLEIVWCSVCVVVFVCGLCCLCMLVCVKEEKHYLCCILFFYFSSHLLGTGI